jgi:uncharacterized SAM-binding protein YcdF (DUF218 family)
VFELTRLASLFVYPLGTTFLFFIAGAVLFGIGRRRSGVAVASFAMAWLWVWSMPATSDVLRRSLESRYPHAAAEDVPIADAAVVLGGGFLRDTAWPYPTASDTVNRYWHGARLYHAGRVRKIVLTGGGDPEQPEKLTEAQAGAVFLKDMGVPEEHILLDNLALNTQQHVGNVAKLLEDNELESFLLVTSAVHMRRAEAVFRAGGLQPIPVATDFRVESEPVFRLRRFLPSARYLDSSTDAVHEYVGYWFYRLRGWIHAP